MFEYLQQLYKNITYIVENSNLLGYDVASVIFIIQYCYKHNVITKVERDTLILQVSLDFEYNKMIDMIKIAKSNLKQNSRKYLYFEVYNPITADTCYVHDIDTSTANSWAHGSLFVSNSLSLSDIIDNPATQAYFKDLEVAEKTLQKFQQSNLMIFPQLIDQRLALKLRPVITDVGVVFV